MHIRTLLTRESDIYKKRKDSTCTSTSSSVSRDGESVKEDIRTGENLVNNPYNDENEIVNNSDDDDTMHFLIKYTRNMWNKQRRMYTTNNRSS